MNRRTLLGLILIIIGIGGIVAFSTVQWAPTYTGPITTPFLAPTTPFPTAPIPGPYQPYPSIPRNIDEATQVAKDYVTSLGYPDLAVKEIMEFQYNYYFIAYEKSTGIDAFEGIIEKGVGLSGMGGMMGRGRGYQPYTGVPTADMPVTKTDARQLAQTYLDSHLSDSSTEEPDTFYGYYTIHVLRDGKAYGMLSVNGYTGQVWYHTWHGTFIQTKELT